MARSFKESLTLQGKGVLDERATNLVAMTKIEATSVLQQHQIKVLQIQNAIRNHQDVAVTTKVSLQPGGKDFSSKDWVEKEVQLAKDLRIATIEYNVVKKWYDTMFPEDTAEAIPEVEDE